MFNFPILKKLAFLSVVIQLFQLSLSESLVATLVSATGYPSAGASASSLSHNDDTAYTDEDIRRERQKAELKARLKIAEQELDEARNVWTLADEDYGLDRTSKTKHEELSLAEEDLNEAGEVVEDLKEEIEELEGGNLLLRSSDDIESEKEEKFKVKHNNLGFNGNNFKEDEDVDDLQKLFTLSLGQMFQVLFDKGEANSGQKREVYLEVLEVMVRKSGNSEDVDGSQKTQKLMSLLESDFITLDDMFDELFDKKTIGEKTQVYLEVLDGIVRKKAQFLKVKFRESSDKVKEMRDTPTEVYHYASLLNFNASERKKKESQPYDEKIKQIKVQIKQIKVQMARIQIQSSRGQIDKTCEESVSLSLSEEEAKKFAENQMQKLVLQDLLKQYESMKKRDMKSIDSAAESLRMTNLVAESKALEQLFEKEYRKEVEDLEILVMEWKNKILQTQWIHEKYLKATQASKSGIRPPKEFLSLSYK